MNLDRTITTEDTAYLKKMRGLIDELRAAGRFGDGSSESGAGEAVADYLTSLLDVRFIDNEIPLHEHFQECLEELIHFTAITLKRLTGSYPQGYVPPELDDHCAIRYSLRQLRQEGSHE